MSFSRRFVLVALVVAVLSPAPRPPAFAQAPSDSPKPRRPNVVIFIADDLGYSDLGCYGGEIKTPNLDSLAANGLRFTAFHNTARCWPSRAAVLTGYYAQQVRRDTVPGIPSGGAGVRQPWARLLPDMLRPVGYRAYFSGKWHVDGRPNDNGFDRSYLLQDLGRYFSPRVHLEDDARLPAPDAKSGYYATVAIADYAVKYLREHAASHGDKPFFLYCAFNAPHFPLHALPEDIASYRDVYTKGWDAVRAERAGRLRQAGLFDGPLPPVERDLRPPYPFPEAIKKFGPAEVDRAIAWAELTEEQRAFQAMKMAIHAALVDRMDREIGKVLEQLRAMKAFEDTLILFLSDNGATAEMMIRDDGHDPAAPAGSAATHLCLGPGWSAAANTPFRRHKTWVHQGGICTPFVAHWPKGIAARGEIRRTPGHAVDLVPTVLELTGGRAPGAADDRAPPLPGRSLAPAFAGDGAVTHEYLWWLHEGNRAIRVGNWKLVAARGAEWELYDMSADPAESNNLAGRHPDKVEAMSREWARRMDEFAATAKKDLPAGALEKLKKKPKAE